MAKPNISIPGLEMYCGGALQVLSSLPAESVDTCVTSPPYYALRDNKVKGQLGLEDTPEEYIQKLTRIMHEVKRVLKPEGTCWLNIGDSYVRNPAKGQHKPNPKYKPGKQQYVYERGGGRASATFDLSKTDLKEKDLIGIPWAVAFALRADGWYLRSDIIYEKKNALPECLAPETRIYVRQNVTAPIRRIALGDLLHTQGPYPLIMTPTGWCEIKHAWEVEKNEVVTFDAAHVDTVTCSSEHLWPISHDRRTKRVDELSTAELRDEGYCDYLLHNTIGEWLDGSLDQVENYKLNYDLGWLVGIYAAEGGFDAATPGGKGHRVKFTFSLEERDLVGRVASLAELTSAPTISIKDQKDSITVRFSSASWHKLAELIVPGQCTTKQLNLDMLLNTPRDFRQGLWDGYIAGDGSVRHAPQTLNVTGVSAASASKDLRDGMAILASSIGLVTSKGDYSSFDARTGKTYQHYTIWTPYFNRKSKADTTAKQITIRNKKTARQRMRMVDLEVDGGLFLIGDGLVTHNSVKDRPTKSHEYVFLLTKSSRYYYNHEAGKEITKSGKKRSKRTVWSMNTKPYKGAHFSVFPEELIEPMVLSGCPQGGVAQDPFIGSGTTAIVALNSGRKAIGIELSAKYRTLALRRIKEEIRGGGAAKEKEPARKSPAPKTKAPAKRASGRSKAEKQRLKKLLDTGHVETPAETPQRARVRTRTKK